MAASAAPSPPVESEIGPLARRVAAGETVEIDWTTPRYQLQAFDKRPYVYAVFATAVRGWEDVNEAAWGIALLPNRLLSERCLCAQCVPDGAERVRLEQARREGATGEELLRLREQAARTVLAAIFAGYDLSVFTCGDQISSESTPWRRRTY